MKAIFLDFDGPIIPEKSYDRRRRIDEKAWPPSVAALNRVTDETGAKIVVSSTWRLDGQKRVTTLLKAWGVTGEVIGVTPRVFLEDERGEEKQAPRGYEIDHFLRKWNEDHPKNKITSFVIFDDDKDMEHLLPFLIHTPFERGINEIDADEAILRLGKKIPGLDADEAH